MAAMCCLTVGGASAKSQRTRGRSNTQVRTQVHRRNF
jgi:hypothetical protein